MTKELEFISLASYPTFKYLYKNIKTRTWIDNIIKKKFNLDLSDYKLMDNESKKGNNVKDYRMDLKLKNDKETVIIEIIEELERLAMNKEFKIHYDQEAVRRKR